MWKHTSEARSPSISSRLGKVARLVMMQWRTWGSASVAGGYVSGEAMLRPVRVGLAIMPGSAGGLRRAVELATSSWGGQGFPVVEAGTGSRAAVRLASAMGVDCFFPVGKDDELEELARTPGFEWVPSWQGLSPFSRDPEGQHEHVLPASVLYDWYRLSRQPPAYHVTWPDGHQLENLLTVWFGQFGADAAGRADGQAFEAIAQGCPLGPGLPLPPYPGSLTCQLSVTMQDVYQQPRIQDRGIVVMDARNVSHLVAFWNLRACGQDVFPWEEGHADLLEEPLRHWLDELASIPPDASGLPPRLVVWVPPEEGSPPVTPAVPSRLCALIGTGRFRLMPQPHEVQPHACGPLITRHVRRFSADTGRSGEAVIPLPALDFLPRRPSWTDLGMVAADIQVRAEPADPSGAAAIVIPAARCIAPHLRGYLPFTRLRGRGRVIPVRVSAESISLMPAHADPLAQKLASDAGYALAVTENGRRLHHRIQLLGGVTDNCIANQPAAREVIRQALRSPYGASAESLIRTARSNDGGWSAKSLGRRGYTNYYARVVGTLAALGILQPLACLTCPQCASTIRVAPAELGEPVRCELCTALVPFGTYIANRPSRPATWAMKATPALDEPHFNETIPVMAALSVFASGGMAGSGMLYLVGAELTKGTATCEIDFMVMVQDAELPAVIIGEAKAGHPERPAAGDLLSGDDLEHLHAIQDALRIIGIDCWICFTTTRPALQQSEIDLLRGSCERSLTPVFDFKSQLLPALPVVLTGEDLSVAVLDDRHPVQRARSTFPRLPALAEDACKRHLGLTGVDFFAGSGEWHARPQWRS
jgi:hypothetical protein